MTIEATHTISPPSSPRPAKRGCPSSFIPDMPALPCSPLMMMSPRALTAERVAVISPRIPTSPAPTSPSPSSMLFRYNEPFRSTTKKPPAAPNRLKRKPSMDISVCTTDKPWKFLAEGDVMSVYRCEEEVLKTPSSNRKAFQSQTKLVADTVNFRQVLENQGFPVAPIINEADAIAECRILMPYYAKPFHSGLISQYKALLQKCQDTKLAVDVKPSNCVDDNGTLRLIDWSVAEGTTWDMAIRAAVTLANDQGYNPDNIVLHPTNFSRE